MNTPPRRFAFTSIAGLAVAAACILGGLLMENGQLQDVGQVTAALIVFGVVGINEVISPVILRVMLMRSGEAGKRKPVHIGH